MRYIHCIVFFLFLACFTAHSQTTTSIHGLVIDSLTKEALFYGHVVLLNPTDSSLVIGEVVDVNGKFELKGVKAGDYLLRASAVGYLNYFLPLQCKNSMRQLHLDTIRMQSAIASLGGVEIVDKKPVYVYDGEKMIYNVSEDAGIQTGTLSDALQNAPGIEVDIEGNVSLRGLTSVEIWINDKPSKLTAENLKTYIQQLPANTLERIEVITNPSAKYAAEGTGGIINIVTSSKILKNSFISFGFFASTRPLYSPWLSFMWANDKLSMNIYLNGNYTTWASIGNGYQLMFNDQKDTSSYQRYENQNKNNSYSGYMYVNLSYTFDTMNTLSFWGNCYGGFSGGKSQSSYYRKEYFPIENIFEYTTDNSNTYQYTGAYGNLYYQHKFNNKGHYIKFSLGGNLSDNASRIDYLRDYKTQHLFDKNKIIKGDNFDYNVNAQVDYAIPYGKKGEISLGISENFSQTTFLSYEDTLLPGTATYLLDSLRFKDILSFANSLEAYVSVRQSFGNFTLNVGCRFQYKFIDYQVLNSPSNNVNIHYPGLFPSLHLSYRTKSMHNFRLSYTRRIAYPNASQLSTFFNYDEESYSFGNPLLEPTYTHSVDGGWSKYFNKIGDVGVSGYYKYSKNEINSLSDVIYSDFYGRMVSFSMPVNAGSGYRAGGEFRFNYRLKSFMSLRFYANVYQSHAKTIFDYEPTSLRNDTLIVTESFTYSFRLNYWAKVFKIIEINASANYRSPTKSLFVENKATYSIDCGLRADFFKRKLSVFVNVRDIFNWNKYEYNRESPYFKAFSTTKYDSRFISAGFTLRFGKIEMESRAREGQLPE
ncbi:MAG: outer membrane beta-barrel protein [Bacteroidales bacterium]|nr:outer membrane beta-barrel protein [Bacteroidales bacterium]